MRVLPWSCLAARADPGAVAEAVTFGPPDLIQALAHSDRARRRPPSPPGGGARIPDRADEAYHARRNDGIRATCALREARQQAPPQPPWPRSRFRAAWGLGGLTE